MNKSLRFIYVYLVSNPRTTAPIDLAAPADANPATPPPMIRTYIQAKNYNNLYQSKLQILNGWHESTQSEDIGWF